MSLDYVVHRTKAKNFHSPLHYHRRFLLHIIILIVKPSLLPLTWPQSNASSTASSAFSPEFRMKSGKGRFKRLGKQSKGGRECWIKLLLRLYKARPSPRSLASLQCTHYTHNLTGYDPRASLLPLLIAIIFSILAFA